VKSGKQRRKEIKEKRLKRAEATAESLKNKTYAEARLSPLSVVEADHTQLTHNNTYGSFPNFYADTPFVCVDCGVTDLWTAKAQKWWYEIAKGSIWSTASRCSSCRKTRREAKEAQKKHMEEMALKEPHPNEKFFKKR